jgi:S1-C subfamily serine protease
LGAAAVGGALVLLVAAAGGWLDRGTRTVEVPALGPRSIAAPVVVARPLTGSGFSPAQIYRRRAAGVVTVISYFDGTRGATGSAGQGSGFVVARDGTILTSAHVVTTAGETVAAHARPARAIYVQFADGDRVQARLVGYDLFDDVGVIRVDPRRHPVVPVPLGDSARVVVGEPVAAIGSPFGNADSLSVGVVSAVRRSIPSLTTRYDLVDAIQTDAPINHGNSGGPLLDAAGRVIGINAQIRSGGGSNGFEGVGFAVPIDSARRSLAQIRRSGRVSYAYLGIRTEDLTPSIAKEFGYAASRGALIDSVTPGSPAARAGLRAGTREVVYEGLDVWVGGDAIVALGGAPVRSAADVVRVVSERLLPGETVRVTVVDGRARRVVSVVLGTRSPSG